MKEPSIINLCDRNFNDIFNLYREDKIPIVQMGSYTCTNYFMHAIKFIVHAITEGNLLDKFDLVIPTLPEHHLDLLKSKEFVECCDRSRQIVVNDFGMLQYLNGKYDIRMGRLFFKDYRDHRYEEYDLSEYEGKSNTVLDFALKNGMQIVAYENDIITQDYKFEYSKKLDIYLHYPYRQISMSHICEYASIGKNIEDKYKADDWCSMQCFNVNIRSETYGYLKIGKSVYEILNKQYLKNIEGSYHLIVTPNW